MNTIKKEINKLLLEKLYHINNKSVSDISSLLNYSKKTIYRYFKKFNISVKQIINRKNKLRKICYCKDCGKELNESAYYENTLRCGSCNIKHFHNNKIINNKGLLAGDKNPMFGKSIHLPRWKKYKSIWMRSSWEIAYAKYLDKNNIKWFYEPEAFDLGNCTYRPDFYLIKTKEYIEIKGRWIDESLKKFKLFKHLNPKKKIFILYKKDLIKLGVL